MGRIRIDSLPWTQPAFAPLYPADGIPVLTRQRWHLGVVFEVDAEAVDAFLPEGVDPASNPAVASVWCATHAHSTFGGPYSESGAAVVVTFEGRTYMYPLVVYLGPGSEEWFAAGREIWGHQKKLGVTRIHEPEGSGIISGSLDRPAGTRLMNLSVGPLTREARPEEIGYLPVLSLRVIPHPERPVPQIAELVVTEAALTPRRGSDGRLEFWAGPGEIAFPVPSERDPLYRLTPRRVLSGYYGCFEGIVTPFAKILKTLVSP